MELMSWVQILNMAVCISLWAHNLKKGIHLFYLQIWVNSKAEWILYPGLVNQSRRKKTLVSKPTWLCLKIDLVSLSTHGRKVEQLHTAVFQAFILKADRHRRRLFWVGLEMLIYFLYKLIIWTPSGWPLLLFMSCKSNVKRTFKMLVGLCWFLM